MQLRPIPAVLAFVLAAMPAAGQEVARAAPEPATSERIPALLITGANNHDWKWTAPRLARILEASGRFAVTITDQPAKTLADAKELARYRVFVLDYNGPRLGAAAEANFLAAVEGGTGVTVVHAANNSFAGWVEYEKMVALCWRKGTGHGRFHAFDVKVTDRDHPLTRDMPDLRSHPDELYHRLVHMHDTDYRVLATAHSSKKSGGSGRAEPMILVKNYGKGRIFHTPLGHVWRNTPGTHASFADPQFRHLLARGTEWAATGRITLPPQPPNFLTAEEKQQGFRLLFDGRSFDGWRIYKRQGVDQGWVVKDGAMMVPARARAGDIMTTEQFGEFDFRFEFKVTRNANSGVIYRVRETQNATYQTGPEYQVLDAAARAGRKHVAGALYDMIAPAGGALRPVGQYNSGRIVLRNGRLQHWLNGTKVLECSYGDEAWKQLVAGSKFRKMPEFGTHATGHIAFQDHGGEVWYRSIRIRSFEAGDK
jgi:type 1 glutamine amidotransferase